MPLYKRPGSPYWWCRIGSKTRVSTGTTDRKLAEEFEETERARRWRQHKLGDRGTVPWREVVARYLKDSRKARKREREFFAWLEEVPAIGGDAVSSVADVDALDQLREDGLDYGWTHSTVDRMMRAVRAVLRFAWRKKLIDQPPAVSMYGEKDAEPRFLTAEEFAALCAQLPKHLALAARFAVLTLLRKGAQAKLTWDRVDLARKTLWIRGQHQKGGRAHGTALSEEACRVLEEVRRLELPGARVFGQAEFRTAAWVKACTRAGIPGTRWHDLRHTGASWAIQSGVTLMELMKLGGWKSYRSVLIYAHLAPENTAKAAEAVGTKMAQSLKGHRAKKP